MDNKKLNDGELEEVNGGQAVLPLLSKEVDEQMLSLGGYLRARCPSCGFELHLPMSQKGKQVECQECHTTFTAPNY